MGWLPVVECAQQVEGLIPTAAHFFAKNEKRAEGGALEPIELVRIYRQGENVRKLQFPIAIMFIQKLPGYIFDNFFSAGQSCRGVFF